jgi:hypothetical protein
MEKSLSQKLLSNIYPNEVSMINREKQIICQKFISLLKPVPVFDFSQLSMKVAVLPITAYVPGFLC